ncbi:hypothetical protein C8J57DRAFT_1525174 [Mycena rebaudengoi]|nr:hypothetical protein C8J57DRAFT_1525174 [Mycena rebaudengoi]
MPPHSTPGNSPPALLSAPIPYASIAPLLRASLPSPPPLLRPVILYHILPSPLPPPSSSTDRRRGQTRMRRSPWMLLPPMVAGVLRLAGARVVILRGCGRRPSSPSARHPSRRGGMSRASPPPWILAFCPDLLFFLSLRLPSRVFFLHLLPLLHLYLFTSWLTPPSFGCVEIPAKLSTGDWVWPALWMLPVDDPYGGWPFSALFLIRRGMVSGLYVTPTPALRFREIDIIEARGNGPAYPKHCVVFLFLIYFLEAAELEGRGGWGSSCARAVHMGGLMLHAMCTQLCRCLPSLAAERAMARGGGVASISFRRVDGQGMMTRSRGVASLSSQGGLMGVVVLLAAGVSVSTG